MIVTVEGLITSKELKKKNRDNKEVVSTELLLAQPGEKMQAAIRLDGNKLGEYELLKPGMFTGRLMAWNSRDGVGMMVMVREEE